MKIRKKHKKGPRNQAKNLSFFSLLRSQDIPVQLRKISTMAALQLALTKFWYDMMRQGRIIGPQNLEIEDSFEAAREGCQSVLECLGIKASTKVLVIFWSTVTAAGLLWGHDQTRFDEAKHEELRMAVVGGEVKRPITALRALPHVDYVKMELETFVALLQDAIVLQQEIDEDTEMHRLFTEMMELASDLLSVLEL